MAICQSHPEFSAALASVSPTGLAVRFLVGLAAVISATGCSTSGGTFTIFPNDHKLKDSTEAIAACAARHHVCERELNKTALPAWYVQPGDQLLIEVNDFDADFRLPPDQTVMLDGSIDLGKFGRIDVSGMSVEEIEGAVLGAIQTVEPKIDADAINVRLMTADGALYYVLGEVNAPGSFPLIGRETALDAILTAGGLSDRAAECRIILSRPTHPCSCRVVLPVCYQDIVQLGDTTTNYQIRPGDRIYVASRSMCDELCCLEHKCELCPDGKQCGCPSPGWSLNRIFTSSRLLPYPSSDQSSALVAPDEVPPASPAVDPDTGDEDAFSDALQLLGDPESVFDKSP